MQSAGVCQITAAAAAASQAARSLHVAFADERGDVGERKKKYLTAKYGQHQMALIKKRLRVEMWMYEQLQALYATPDDANSEVEIDLDELLDMENDGIRKDFLLNKLHGAKKSREVVESFVEQLITRAKTL